jgi:hypothetical protein
LEANAKEAQIAWYYYYYNNPSLQKKRKELETIEKEEEFERKLRADLLEPSFFTGLLVPPENKRKKIFSVNKLVKQKEEEGVNKLTTTLTNKKKEGRGEEEYVTSKSWLFWWSNRLKISLLLW